MNLIQRTAIAGLSVLVFATPAAAANRQTGERLVYDFTTSVKQLHMPDGIPAIALARMQTQASEKATMTISVAQIDGAGGGSGTLQYASPEHPTNNATVDVFFAKGGAINPKTNPDLEGPNAPQPAYGARYSPAQINQINAQKLVDFLEPINIAATGIAKRPALAIGDRWNVSFHSSYSSSTNMTVNYVVSGKQDMAGRSVMVVAMDGKDDSAMMTVAYTSTAYYDPIAGIVVGVHAERRTVTFNHGDTLTVREMTLKS